MPDPAVPGALPGKVYLVKPNDMTFCYIRADNPGKAKRAAMTHEGIYDDPFAEWWRWPVKRAPQFDASLTEQTLTDADVMTWPDMEPTPDREELDGICLYANY